MTHSAFLTSDRSFYDLPPGTIPFSDAEAAWFWCVRTSEALHGGARIRLDLNSRIRPCEAVDIQTVVLRLARQKVLTDRHVKTLVAYGPRQTRPMKKTSAHLWQQAMDRITPVLQQKGIVSL